MTFVLSTTGDKVLSRYDKSLAMSDVARAQALVLSVWEPRSGLPAKVRIGQIFDALKRVERKLDVEEFRARPRQWTERRVRSIWEGSARRVDAFEMIDLERAALEAARAEHKESIERSKRLEAFLASAVATQDREVA